MANPLKGCNRKNGLVRRVRRPQASRWMVRLNDQKQVYELTAGNCVEQSSSDQGLLDGTACLTSTSDEYRAAQALGTEVRTG
jgi:hypothetical protein